jgi:hypothetical protein
LAALILHVRETVAQREFAKNVPGIGGETPDNRHSLDSTAPVPADVPIAARPHGKSHYRLIVLLAGKELGGRLLAARKIEEECNNLTKMLTAFFVSL